MNDRPTTPGSVPKPETPRELQSVIFAERELTPFLFYRDQEAKLEIFQLTPAIKVTIGRHTSNSLALAFDQTVSGVHLELHQVGEEWVVEDDGLSTNGTFLNGIRVTGRKRLDDGDLLRVGDTSLVFRNPIASGAGGTLVPHDQVFVKVTPAQMRVLIELCRPVVQDQSALPASNGEIAETLFLSVETVKTHIRDLYEAFDLEDAEPRAKRSTLVTRAQQTGMVKPGDYVG